MIFLICAPNWFIFKQQIKTPAEINPMVGGKSKRSSMSSLLFKAHKDSSVLTPPQLVLKQCKNSGSSKATNGTAKVMEHMLQLGAGAKSGTSGSSFRDTPFFNAATVTNLFGGPLLSMNTLNTKESDAVMTAAALAKRHADAAAAAAAAETRKGPAGPPALPDPNSAEDDGSRVITDVDATIRELKAIHPAAPYKQVSMFYTLVSAKWLKSRLAQEAAVAANALAAQQASKDKSGGKKHGRKVAGSAGDEASVANEKKQSQEEGGGDGGGVLQLVAVGPALQHVDTVRWDYKRNLCALVLTGSAAVNILRLDAVASDDDSGFPQFHLQTLISVDLGGGIPSSLSNAFCSLCWSEGVLIATPLSSAMVKIVLFSERQLAGSKDDGYCQYLDSYEIPYQTQVCGANAYLNKLV